jgi:hypothetical protein
VVATLLFAVGVAIATYFLSIVGVTLPLPYFVEFLVGRFGGEHQTAVGADYGQLNRHIALQTRKTTGW